MLHKMGKICFRDIVKNSYIMEISMKVKAATIQFRSCVVCVNSLNSTKPPHYTQAVHLWEFMNTPSYAHYTRIANKKKKTPSGMKIP